MVSARRSRELAGQTLSHGLLLAVAAAGLLAGCGSNEPTSPFAPADPAGPLFAPDHVTEVAIEIDPAKWDALRRQTRTWGDVAAGPECMSRPFSNPFTWFPASVTVDGIRRDGASVRKKGFVGSMDESRPALKVAFDGVDPDRTLHGLKKLTLNNSFQDPTWLRQCLSCRVFGAAEIPVPWCNFAHVTVNGQDLGLYVNLESTDRRWIRRSFERDEGDLWEGTLSDFRFGWIGTFEKKGDVEDSEQMQVDRSSLWKVADAVSQTVPDSEVRGRLERVIDFDEFMRFWAVEKILEHWDGYANSANNFLIYRDPDDDRFAFVPSGTDQITVPDPWEAVHPPVSVYAGAALTNRLYGVQEMRELYAKTLRRMLDSAFHEDDLLAHVDRMQALATPVLTRAGADVAAQAKAVADLRAWIAGRRTQLVADLQNGPPEWQQEPTPSACIANAGQVEGWFATTFDPSSNPFDNPFRGTATINGTYRGRGLNIWRAGASAGYDPNAPTNPWPLVYLTGYSADGMSYNIGISVNPAQFRPGSAGRFDGVFAYGWMGSWNPWTWQWTYLGGFDGGRIELDAAGLQRGARVSGRFQGRVIRW
jgi:hypothetical protein